MARHAPTNGGGNAGEYPKKEQRECALSEVINEITEMAA